MTSVLVKAETAMVLLGSTLPKPPSALTLFEDELDGTYLGSG